MEFGLCVENNELKIYGAGLLSSVGELKHVVEGIRNSTVAIQRFTVDEAHNTECVVTSFQKRYFYTNTIDDAKEELRFTLLIEFICIYIYILLTPLR